MLHKILRYSLGIFLIYFLFSVIIVPIWYKDAGQEQTAYAKSTAQSAVLCIDDNEEALYWRLKVIGAAQEEIVMSTFDWREDNGGTDVMAALAQAAERGVKVRLVVDGINGFLQLRGSGLFQALTAYPNVEAKLYNPINLLLPYRINYRLHDKYLIADDTVYILGGRNTNDLFLGNYREQYNLDRDVLVYEGKDGAEGSLGLVKDYFEKVWEDPASKRYRHHKGKQKTLENQEILRQRYLSLTEKYPDLEDAVCWEEKTLPVESIALLTNPVEVKGKEPLVWNGIYQEIEGGRDILIQTPYIICDRLLYGDLQKAVEQGKKVEILTNAVESGANPWGCTDYLNQKQKVLGAGVSVYECLAGQSLHTKTVLVDDDISLIGSYNLDIRSTYLDTEMMLRIESRQLNAALREKTQFYQEQSKKCMPDGTEQIGDSYEAVVQGPVKKAIYAVLRLVVRPIRHLL